MFCLLDLALALALSPQRVLVIGANGQTGSRVGQRHARRQSGPRRNIVDGGQAPGTALLDHRGQGQG